MVCGSLFEQIREETPMHTLRTELATKLDRTNLLEVVYAVTAFHVKLQEYSKQATTEKQVFYATYLAESEKQLARLKQHSEEKEAIFDTTYAMIESFLSSQPYRVEKSVKTGKKEQVNARKEI